MEPKLTFSGGARSDASVKVDFYKLSRAVQERFMASAQQQAAPVPILFRRASRRGIATWAAIAVVLAVAAWIVLHLGYGDLASSLAIQSKTLLAIDAALMAASVFAVVRAIRIVLARRSLPFTPGIYVFPASVIDASTHVLRVHAMQDLASMERKPTPVSTFHFAFTTGAKYAFPEKDLDRADQVERVLAVAKTDLAKALEDESPRAMAGIDPLYDAALSSPLGPSEPLKRIVPVWTRFDWAIALVTGAAIALPVWVLRNRSSDERMYITADVAKSVDAYKRYLAQGGKHSDEVASTLLPRAELREAEKAGTVEAMQAYVKSHPNSKIAGEVGVSMRKVMLAELEKAKTEKTVSALKAFAAKYPDHKLKNELAAATHALYVAALDGYKHLGPDKDSAGAVTALERALKFAEANGPDAEVRFRLRTSKTMDDADAQLAKSKHWMGDSSKPSAYFAADKMRPREEALAKRLVDRFSEAFPADVLSVKAGAPITDSGDALPAFKVPTLVVDYAVEWSHTAAVSTKPHGIFAGVNVPFEISFNVPGNGGGKLMSVKVLSWRGPELWGKKKDELPTDHPAVEKQVYGSMADGSFAQLEKKALETFFHVDDNGKK